MHFMVINLAPDVSAGAYSTFSWADGPHSGFRKLERLLYDMARTSRIVNFQPD